MPSQHEYLYGRMYLRQRRFQPKEKLGWRGHVLPICQSSTGLGGGPGDSLRRRHIVVEASVFVKEHKKQRRIPDFFIGAQSVVDACHQLLTVKHVVRRMVIICSRWQIAWLDPEETRKFICVRNVRIELDHWSVAHRVLGFPLVDQDQRDWGVTEVDLPAYVSFVKTIKDCCLVIPV